MPLSPTPVERTPWHAGAIRIEAFERDDGPWEPDAYPAGAKLPRLASCDTAGPAHGARIGLNPVATPAVRPSAGAQARTRLDARPDAAFAVPATDLQRIED